jgi:hypothetical protein
VRSLLFAVTPRFVRRCPDVRKSEAGHFKLTLKMSVARGGRVQQLWRVLQCTDGIKNTSSGF